MDKYSVWRRWKRFYSSWEEGEWQRELMKANVRFYEQHWGARCGLKDATCAWGHRMCTQQETRQGYVFTIFNIFTHICLLFNNFLGIITHLFFHVNFKIKEKIKKIYYISEVSILICIRLYWVFSIYLNISHVSGYIKQNTRNTFFLFFLNF